MHDTFHVHRFLSVCQEELAKIVVEMPYSSCTPLIRAFHPEALHDKFGDVCVQQLFQVTDRVTAATGVSFEYLRDGRHLTGIAKFPGMVVVLDPYLSHLQPVTILSQPDCDSSSTRVPAAPFVEDRDGVVHASYVEAKWNRSSDELDIAQVKWSLRDESYRVSRRFNLSFSRTVDRSLSGFDYRPFLFHPEQTSLSVRYVEPRSLAYLEARLMLEGDGSIEYRINSRAVSSAESSWFWSSVCRNGPVDQLEIENYIRTAHGCYVDNISEWKLSNYE